MYFYTISIWTTAILFFTIIGLYFYEASYEDNIVWFFLTNLYFQITSGGEDIQHDVQPHVRGVPQGGHL